MKKTILLTLALLPIVLVIIIALAGRIIPYFVHIAVERVEFVDRNNNVYTDVHTFTVTQGANRETKISIYPELASNKKVTYKSADESICTIDENGVVTGVHYGRTTVTVTTDEGNFFATLNVRVKCDIPESVSIVNVQRNEDTDKKELSMLLGGIFQLECEVEADEHVSKLITYESDNPTVVTVARDGKLTALAEGTAVITVKTEVGELIDTCTVTVEEGELPIDVDLDGVDGVNAVQSDIGTVYELSTDTLNISEYIVVSDEVNIDDVKITIKSGTATIDNGVITLKANSLITVLIYAGDDKAPLYSIEINIIYKK